MSPSLLEIALLSIIQGLAEPLPVSSTAHVIAAERLMRLNPSSPEMTFLLAMLHTGTVAAVIAFFWKSWRARFFSGGAELRESAWRVGSATVATLAVFFILQRVIRFLRPGSEIEDLFSNLPLIATALAAGGILILVAGLKVGGASEPDAGQTPGVGAIGARRALWIGAVQGIVLPFRGLSRSGATISVAMLLGIPRRLAEEFSFALVVIITPPVVAQELLRFYKARAAGPGAVHLASLVAPGLMGMAFSFVAGLLALRWLSGWLEKGRWHYFGIYCLAASAGVVALSAAGY